MGKMYLYLLLPAIGFNIQLFTCEAPNAICPYGQNERVTFQSVLQHYLRYQPRHNMCRSQDTKLDTDLVHGIRTLDADLVATTINKRKSRSCPIPLYPSDEYLQLEGLSAQLIAAVQLELLIRNQEPEDSVQVARNIVTIVSGGATEYMTRKWNPRRYR